MFVIDLSTRRVEVVGVHADPCETQMIQWARKLTDAESGFLKGKRLLIHGRDPLFTRKFRATIKAGGVRCMKMPKQSPNLNAYAESFVRTIKRECLDKMVLFGEKHVRLVVDEYVELHNAEWPHKAMDYRRPIEPEVPPPEAGEVVCNERLGGLLRSYCRAAA